MLLHEQVHVASYLQITNKQKRTWYQANCFQEKDNEGKFRAENSEGIDVKDNRLLSE
jgi:hypothetical protein